MVSGNMLWATRIISWVLVVTGGLTWTIGQAGLDATDKNLCEFASKVWQGPIPDCHIVPVLVGFWKVVLFAALAFLVVDFYNWAKKRKASARPPLLQDREIGLIHALFLMESSAWGRWQLAQDPLCPTDRRLLIAASVFRTAALNGDLLVRGRPKKSVKHDDIDRDFWHSAYIGIQADNASAFKPVIRAMGDVEIPDYDSFLVERQRVQLLWPQREWKYYWPTFTLRLKAALKRKPRPMPEIDGNEETKKEEVPSPDEAEALSPVVEVVAPPAPSSISITPRPEALEGWEKLFAIGDDGKSLWLRFLPDKGSAKSNTLLLIVYAHKVLLGEDKVLIDSAHAAVKKSVDVAPRRSYSTKTPNLRQLMAMASWSLQGEEEDFAEPLLGSSLRRVGLSQGGMYELTEFGEREAVGLAYDLIQRA